MSNVTEIEKPAESPYYIAHRMEMLIGAIENASCKDAHFVEVAEAQAALIKWSKVAIEMLRWYDWQDEQIRRRKQVG